MDSSFYGDEESEEEMEERGKAIAVICWKGHHLLCFVYDFEA